MRLIKFEGGDVDYEKWGKEETVELLEDWLEKAKKGEIIGIAIMGHSNKGEIVTAFGGVVFSHIFKTVGGLEYLKQRIMENIEE